MMVLLKIAVTPLLVAAVSLAARWWGPTVGGILMGLPWFTGPVLFILIQERGSEFGVAACLGVEIGVICISAFMLVYGLVAAVAGWPLSLAAAMAAFFAGAMAIGDPALLAQAVPGKIPPLWAAAGAGALSLLVVLALLPRPRGQVLPLAPPWWDIPARMAATAGLVAALVLGADALGPRLAGVLASYPIILTVAGTFTHRRWGRDAVWRVLRGLAASLFGFVVFFLVVGLTLPTAGVVGAYALASLSALAMTAALLAAHRAQRARRARWSEAVERRT
jgi:hypothetical protein